MGNAHHFIVQKKLYPGVEEKYLVHIDIIVSCIKMFTYEGIGEYLNGQTIGFYSPWQKYLDERISDLRSRGCSNITKNFAKKNWFYLQEQAKINYPSQQTLEIAM